MKKLILLSYFLLPCMYSAQPYKLSYLSLNPNDSIYRCELCDMGFYGEDTLQAHKKGSLHQKQVSKWLSIIEEIRQNQE